MTSHINALGELLAEIEKRKLEWYERLRKEAEFSDGTQRLAIFHGHATECIEVIEIIESKIAELEP